MGWRWISGRGPFVRVFPVEALLIALGVVVDLYRPFDKGVGRRLAVLSIINLLNQPEQVCHGVRLVMGLPQGSSRTHPIRVFVAD